MSRVIKTTAVSFNGLPLQGDSIEIDFSPMVNARQAFDGMATACAAAIPAMRQMSYAITAAANTLNELVETYLLRNTLVLAEKLAVVSPGVSFVQRVGGLFLYVSDTFGDIVWNGNHTPIEWWHDYLVLCYGERFFSPPVTLSNGQQAFSFLQDAAFRRNPRWMMYTNIACPFFEEPDAPSGDGGSGHQAHRGV